MNVTQEEKQVLRRLGQEVAEIASLPAQEETRKLWKDLNGLKPARPMVMIDQIPWHEMNVNDELTVCSRNELCRNVETNLRRTIYKWNHMPVDMLVGPYIPVQRTIHGTDLGIHIKEDRAILDEDNNVVGHFYIDQLKTEDDLEKIKIPRVVYDKEATERDADLMREIFDGVLDVRLTGPIPTFAIWDRIVTWHGVENSIIDLVDRPDFIHKMLARVTKAYMSLLDQLEDQGLLGRLQSTIHCTGASSHELPASDFDPEHTRAKDLWTFGMAQIFSTVSPAMHKEFEIDYAVQWFKRFGLGYYGCCEPLHDKIDIIRDIPRVRKISMSPWADVQKGAERLAGDYVFSNKPNPAFVAGNFWDPGIIRKDLQRTKTICVREKTPLEFILKDISTVNYKPERLWQWADIAMSVARE